MSEDSSSQKLSKKDRWVLRMLGHLNLSFGPVSAVIVTVVAYMSPQFLLGLILGLFILVTGLNSDTVFDFISDTTVGQFSTTAVAYLTMLAVIVWYMKHYRVTWSKIGLGRGMVPNDLLYAVVAFVGYFLAAAAVLAVVGKAFPSINLEQEQQIGFDSAQGLWQLSLVFVCLVILPPIVEEIMIRGFLYSGLRTKMKPVIAALVASTLFGLAHLQLGLGAPPLYVAAIDTFVLSMILIGLRAKTGSLWAGILVHALKNGLAFMALFVFATFH